MPMDGRFFGKVKSSCSCMILYPILKCSCSRLFYLSQIRHLVTNKCLEKPASKSFRNQPSGSASLASCISQNDLSQMFIMIYDDDTDSGREKKGSIATDESVCLDISNQADQELKPRVQVVSCSGLENQKWIYNEDVSIKIN